jgi:pyruvate dehydrogenase E2 component (dihydrolipoamide acetyltransferase)
MTQRIDTSPIRKAIAKNMTNSLLTSPSCSYTLSADAKNIIEYRQKYMKENNCKISYLDIIIKICAQTLKEFAYVNSSYDYENHQILLHEDINVGFALAHEDVLFAPNIKKVDSLSIVDIRRELERIVSDVRENRFQYEDHTGGTFTITNMGAYTELDEHCPIINQPEMAILATYAIKQVPAVCDNQLCVKEMMKLVLVADHRVIDGKLAYEFLNRVKQLLENPDTIEA